MPTANTLNRSTASLPQVAHAAFLRGEDMASHFSTMGFQVDSDEDFNRLARQAIEAGEEIKSPRGYYVRWAAGEGIELWVGGNERRELVACNPHFTGSSRMRVGVTEVCCDAQTPLDGSLRAWADPETDDPESGAYPFPVDVPDFDLIRDRLSCPLIATMQIAAFADELECFADDAEFAASQDSEMKLAAQSFIPSGLFLAVGNDAQPSAEVPRTEVMFAGHVQQAELCTNPVTQLQFHYLSVRTLGGSYDVVADPEIVVGEPVVAGVVQGVFWLSGRIVSELPPRQQGILG